MKKILLFLSFIMIVHFSNAQTVGIGTNQPNSSAALDVTSTDKGFLLPLLSQTARLNITNPADGLMVYDTTFQRFYQFQQGTWRYIMNSDFWEQASDKNNLYNLADSVGIGTSNPTRKLDVNGNIQATQNITVASSITGTGSAQADKLLAQGNLSAGGTLVVQGNINGDSGLVIDATEATLQFKRNGTDKGFVQRIGNDLKIGTNFTNTEGETYIRMNGKNVVKMDKEGTFNLITSFFPSFDAGKMVIGNRVINSFSVTANTNALPVLYGRINSDGFGAAMWPQSGSAARISTGVYEINTNRNDMSDFGVIVITAIGVIPRICVARYIGNAKFRIEIFNLAGNPINNDFFFIVNDPLN